jgi:hypothetical protein
VKHGVTRTFRGRTVKRTARIGANNIKIKYLGEKGKPADQEVVPLSVYLQEVRKN